MQSRRQAQEATVLALLAAPTMKRISLYLTQARALVTCVSTPFASVLEVVEGGAGAGVRRVVLTRHSDERGEEELVELMAAVAGQTESQLKKHPHSMPEAVDMCETSDGRLLVLFVDSSVRILVGTWYIACQFA